MLCQNFVLYKHCQETNPLVAIICAYVTHSEVLSDEIYVRKTGISISLFIVLQPKILTHSAVGGALISFFSYFHYLYAYHGYREHLGQNVRYVTVIYHGQLRSCNKKLFYCNQLEIEIETSFTRMHNYKLPISYPYLFFWRGRKLVFGCMKEKKTKEMLSTTDAKTMVASTLNMKSPFCFLNLIQFRFCLPEDYTS